MRNTLSRWVVWVLVSLGLLLGGVARGLAQVPPGCKPRLSLSPSSGSTTPGDRIDSDASFEASGTCGWTVQLSLLNAPDGITVLFKRAGGDVGPNASGTFHFTVRVAPNVPPGMYPLEIHADLMVSVEGRKQKTDGISATFTLTVERVAGLAVTATSLDFGTVQLGATATQRTLTIRSVGTGDLTLKSAGISGGTASPFYWCLGKPSDVTLAPGQSVDWAICFQPKVAGSFQDSVTFQTNDPNRTTVTIPLKGVTSGGPPSPTAIRIYPERIDFAEVSSSEATSEHFMINNVGDAPIVLSASTSAPFHVSLSDTVLRPAGVVIGEVTVLPNGPGAFSGAVAIQTDQPGILPVQIPLQGAAIVIPPAQLSAETVLISVLPEAVWVLPDSNLYYFAVIVPSPGPGRSEAKMDLSLSANLPLGATASFYPTEISLGLYEIALLTVRVPRPLSPPLAAIYELRVNGDVMVGGIRVVSVASPLISLQVLFDVNPPVACDCPQGVTPPTLTTALDHKNVGFPDPAPPMGTTPDQSPVATVDVTVNGPKVGECCKNAKFDMVLTVSNEAPGHKDWPGGINGLTGNYLGDGFCKGELSASTNGNAMPVSGSIQPTGGMEAPIDCPTPLNPNGNLDGYNRGGAAVRIRTHFEVPVTCNGVGWSCAVARKRYKTTFELQNTGKFEIFWDIDIEGKNCTITKVSASIGKILFFRNQSIYDPGQKKYVAQDAQGADGLKNYDRILMGK